MLRQPLDRADPVSEAEARALFRLTWKLLTSSPVWVPAYGYGYGYGAPGRQLQLLGVAGRTCPVRESRGTGWSAPDERATSAR